MMKTKALRLKLFLAALLIIGCTITFMNLDANRYISTFNPDNKEETAININEIIKKSVEESRFNGTVLVSRDNNIVFNEGYGYAKRFLGKQQNLPDTKFLLASITKAFTAQAIMSLQDKNDLSIEDTVEKYYPDYPAWKDISIHQLLNHTSGIVNYYKSPWDFVRYFLFPQTPEKIMTGVKNAPLLFEAGEDYKYSNTNYIILSGIIEKASQKSYIDYLNEHIIGPMGLSNTGYKEYPYQVENMAKGYCANMIVEVNGFNLSNFYGAGGLYSTTEDLYKFLQAIDEEILVNDQTKKHVRDDDYYGYGFMLEDSKDYGRIYFHTGGGPGISTGMYKFVDLDVIVVILGNNMQCSTGDIAKDIADLFLE